VVTATKVDQTRSASVTLDVTDVAGTTTRCDPVLTSLTVTRGGPVSQTFSDIPQAEHFVTIQNGDPGLKRLEVTVNGTRFRLDDLRSGEERTLDIGSAMTAGSNSVTLRAQGERSASAVVSIGDTGDAAGGEQRSDGHGHGPAVVQGSGRGSPHELSGWGHLVSQHEEDR
jgi:hypothetical protein